MRDVKEMSGRSSVGRVIDEWEIIQKKRDMELLEK